MSIYLNSEGLIKVFILGVLGFLIALILAPVITNFLYKNRLWKKRGKESAIDGKAIPVFLKYHSKNEVSVPRMGGLIIWITVLFLSFFFFIISEITNIQWLDRLNFLSRGQTWLPLFALVVASIIGLFDDLLQTVVISEKNRLYGLYGKIKEKLGDGLPLRYRIILVSFIGLVGGLWFYYRLGAIMISVPFVGPIFIGIFYIPLFMLVMVATYSGGVIDGIDGLSGGTFASIFGAYTVIALYQQQFNLAAFSAVTMGAILAFLWFNIPPARFYMSETGIIGLCAALTTIAFLTDSILVLPIIAFLLVISSGSVIIQLLSKKYLKKKIFLAAPIHHHFEAIGWSQAKITMRFWIVGLICAIIGVTIKLI